MSSEKVTIFQPYSFSKGQKIRIDGGKRAGDWEIVCQSERTVTLRCPISNKEFEWSRFCYFTEEKDNEPWPSPSND